MSMQELTDDQLDGLFRKSSEEFDPPYDPAAWQALQSRLDAQQPAAPTQMLLNRRLIRWGLPVLILLLTGSVWYAQRLKPVANTAIQPPQIALSDRYAINEKARPTSSVRPEAVDIGTSGRKSPAPPAPVSVGTGQISPTKQPADSPVAGSPPQPERLESKSDPVREGRAAATAVPTSTDKDNRLIAQRLDKPDQLMRSIPPTRRRLNRPMTGVTTFSERTIKQRTRRQNTPFFSESGHAINDAPAFSKRMVTNGETGGLSIPGPNVTRSEAIERVSLPALVNLMGHPGQLLQVPALIDREVAPLVVSEQPVVIKPVVQQKGLSVRFVVSPDLSTVGLRNYSRPGTNVGLLLEYRLASRWSVQAGVIQSTKVYRALTSQYELPPYVANLRVPPESVNGRCNMLDIPVNLRYDLALRSRSNGLMPSRWFVSGGTTTYIMKQEDYDYNYPAGAHLYPSTPRGAHEKTGKWFNFSQLNLSGGYERTLSRRLSGQIEPFVKVPLRGVGYYNINLLSTGAFLSLRYKL